MTAHSLLAPLFPNVSLPEREIQSVTEDTRVANASSIFVCIKGARADGHLLSDRAYASGCRIFIAEHALSLPQDATVLLTDNTRRTLAVLACAFYGHPSHRMHIIGITGTKGKTTTALLLSQILNQCGIPCGYIGTNGIAYGQIKKGTVTTTPDAITLQRTLADMLASDVRTAVLEVSSQALMQFRADGTKVQTALFTNLYSDHIGPLEHASFEEYRAYKKRLFTDFDVQNVFWNADDPHTEHLRVGCNAPSQRTYAITASADLIARRITPYRTPSSAGIGFDFNGTSYRLPLVGRCNVANALLAVGVATEVFGLSADAVAHALQSVYIDGRSEWIPLPSGAAAVIDYAHNGESLRQILLSLREYASGQLICLFGSVGERSQLRRADLGRAAAELADLCVLTSDNPGREAPEKIIDEIAQVLAPEGIPYTAIPDRRAAIEYALSVAQSGDVLLLAGKGHEEYQLIGMQRLPFSERQIVTDYIKAFSTVI